MMKKSLLALAIAALSANAFAVDLDAGTGVSTFASEIDVTSSGQSVGTNTKMQTIATAGFGLTDGYIRYDLGNGATFATALGDSVTAGLTTNPVPSSLVSNIPSDTNKYTIASGGKAGDNFVIYAVKGVLAAADKLTLSTDAKVVNKSAVPVTYAIYETAAGAANKVGSLSTKSGNLLTFAPALVVTATNYVSDKIDAIGNKSLTFRNGYGATPDKTKAQLVSLNIGVVTPNAPLKADGSASVAANDILSKFNWNLKGNFSAIAATNGLVYETAAAALDVATDKQSANKDVTLSTATFTDKVIYTVTGKDSIAETSVGAVFTPTAKTGYKVDSLTFDNIASLTKNGTTEVLNLALKPGGAFSNFVRISNTDTIPGLFFIKVINDAGESVSFPLSDVAGQPASIAAGASTAQISIADIFAAAEAQGLALTGEGKLRLEVTGQTTKFSLQEFTVSTDGTTFATF